MFGNNALMFMMLGTRTKKSGDDLMKMSLTMEMFGNRWAANQLRKVAMFKMMSDGSLKTPFGGETPSYNIGNLQAQEEPMLYGDDIAGLGELNDMIAGDESYNMGGDEDYVS